MNLKKTRNRRDQYTLISRGRGDMEELDQFLLKYINIFNSNIRYSNKRIEKNLNKMLKNQKFLLKKAKILNFNEPLLIVLLS